MAAKFNGIYIIAADTGNGNVKTVSTCTPTSVLRFDTKPITTTINILRIRNGVVIEDSLHTEMLGVNECVKEILNSLKDKTFTDVDESLALDYIKTGESSISEIYVDEMKRIISIYCGKVMKLLTRNGYNRNFMNLYICGGGARVMKKFCPAVANDDKVF